MTIQTSRPDPFAARLLDSGAAALAAAAIDHLFQSSPEAEERFGGRAFDIWHSNLVQRVNELAAAVAEGEPRLFVSQARWARTSFRARNIPEEVLRASLTALRTAVVAELPERALAAPTATLDAALEELAGEARPSTALDPADGRNRLALDYVLALLEGDARGAIQLVLDAADGGLTFEEAYLEVLAPAQREIGRMWHTAEIGVAEEHLATATTRRVMALLSQRATPAPANGKTVIVAAVAGNIHDLGVQMASDFFEVAGWKAIFLGADMPAPDLAAAALFYETDLVVLAVTLTTQLRELHHTVDRIRQTCGDRVRLVVGGRALDEAPQIAEQIAVDGYAASLPAAVALGSELVGV